MIMHALAWSVLMGVGIVALMVAGIVNGLAIALAALAGFVLAMPVTWLVTRQIMHKPAVRS
ncbi:hypothetical protein I5E68_17845 [Novosphingobium sp. YJ-S2-02]|uniref:CTP synthetase n=1 Tax=Novosphingobium aureum TaxID=2792964 RepID=A0A931HFG0_9SPHN|nr:hypothetical protein [Novosphingobium aureum]MBH0114814.1 hypothetical protein [Novosphingobium aureum]